MPTTPEGRRAALFLYVDLFLDEVESRERELDGEECEWLAEIFVGIGTGRHDCDNAMWRLEMLLATDIPMHGRRRQSASDLPTIAEYRALLQLLRNVP